MQTFTHTLPGSPRAIELLRALKGAPLSCLFALHIARPHPLDREQLALMTGWKKDVVTSAMKLLCDLYGLAARVSRYAGWILTDTGHQLLLPGIENAARALGEGDKIAFPPHVCMYDDEQPHPDGETIIHHAESDKIAFPNSEALAQVTQILEAAGIQGPNLQKLAQRVSPETAEKWQDWIARCDRSVWRQPQGFCFRTLDKDAHALPPALPPAQIEKRKKLKPSITGKLARTT